MFSQEKFIKILIGIIALFASILAYQIFVNKGYLIIKNVEPPFLASFPRYGTLDCNKLPCEYSIKPNTYNVTINKDGFYETSKIINIKRWEKNYWKAELKKIPVLTRLKEMPSVFEKKFFPIPVVGDNPFGISKDGEVFYLNLKTGQFFQGTGRERVLLSEFTNLKEAKIYPDIDYVYLISGKEIYEISIKKKQKHLIYSDLNIKNLFINNNSIYIETENEIFAKFKDTNEFIKLPITTSAKLICTPDNKNIFVISFNKIDSQIETDFWKFDMENVDQPPEKIISSTGKLKPLKISCEDKNSFLLLLEEDEAYRLEF